MLLFRCGCGSLGGGDRFRYELDSQTLDGTAVRLYNSVVAPLASETFTLQKLALYDGMDNRRTYMA